MKSRYGQFAIAHVPYYSPSHKLGVRTWRKETKRRLRHTADITNLRNRKVHKYDEDRLWLWLKPRLRLGEGIKPRLR